MPKHRLSWATVITVDATMRAYSTANDHSRWRGSIPRVSHWQRYWIVTWPVSLVVTFARA